jgi:NAD(P)H-flavin reductase
LAKIRENRWLRGVGHSSGEIDGSVVEDFSRDWPDCLVFFDLAEDGGVLDSLENVVCRDVCIHEVSHVSKDIDWEMLVGLVTHQYVSRHCHAKTPAIPI